MRVIATLLLILITIPLIFMVMGFRINTTKSIPIGIYRISPITQHLKNKFIIFCPENRAAFQLALKRHYIKSGLCPGGYGYLMKKVVAEKGDIVTVNANGVFVNNKYIPYSKPKSHDSIGRALPQWRANHYQLKENELLTMTSQSEVSFDARYYGVVRVRQVVGVVRIWFFLA